MRIERCLAELRTATYLNKTEIRRLFGLSQAAASKVYEYAKELDNERLKYKIYSDRVTRKAVNEVLNVD